ncbi:Serine carboxypeptidase-like 18 [Hordeum vulgare]|nr:Serine carboxypeptidase-like 18 [Hordeum vulgare]
MSANRVSFPVKYLGLPLSVWQLKKVDVQYLEDKAANKLATWDGQNINATSHTALVKSVISSQAIFSITPLTVPTRTLNNLNKLEPAFLWSGADKSTGASCKVNWNTVCRPKDYGGLGVLNTDKFARALCLQWLWYEWKAPNKPWVDLGNPCMSIDRDFFYASTTSKDVVLGLSVAAWVETQGYCTVIF